MREMAGNFEMVTGAIGGLPRENATSVPMDRASDSRNGIEYNMDSRLNQRDVLPTPKSNLLIPPHLWITIPSIPTSTLSFQIKKLQG